MNNKINKFIRYYDRQMSVEEMQYFENELLLDPNLREEYSNFRLKFETLRDDVKINETYFNNLVYNSFNRQKETKKTFGLKAAFAIPILLLILLMIFPFKGGDDTYAEIELVEFINEYSDFTNLAGNLFENDLNYHIYGFDEILLSDILDEEAVFDESVFDYLDDNIMDSDINDNLINQISNDEFKVIYNEIAQKIIIGEK